MKAKKKKLIIIAAAAALLVAAVIVLIVNKKSDGRPKSSSLVFVKPGFVDAESACYFSENDMLKVMDKSTGEIMPLCNRPNCKHQSSSECCSLTSGGGMLDFTLTACNGKLYYLGEDAEGIALFEVSLDGSSKERLTTVFEFENPNSAGWGYITFMASEGYGYLSMAELAVDSTELNKVYLYKVELKKDSEPEEIAKEEGDHYIMDVLQVAEGRVYYNIHHLEYAEQGEAGAALISFSDYYEYNTKDGTSRLIMKKTDKFISMAVFKDNVYMGTADGELYKISEGNSPEKCFEYGNNGIVRVLTNGDYLFALEFQAHDQFYSDMTLHIYDSGLKELGWAKCSNIQVASELGGGDRIYLKVRDDEKAYIIYLDLPDSEKGEMKFKILSESEW